MGSRERLLQAVFARFLAGWDRGSIAAQRARQERLTRFVPLPRGVHVRQEQAGAVPVTWFEPSYPGPGDRALLYLHGGAYALGSVQSHREWIARMTQAVGWPCLGVDYRRAPEHPFPAALEDSLTAWRWLRQQAGEGTLLVLAGDSAGGGLALSVMLALREADEPLPAAAMLFSPWVDLTLSGDSVRTRADRDPVLSPDSLYRYAALYAGETDRAHPLLSPLFAELSGLPPLLVHVGTEEILFDDARRLVERARAAHVDARLRIWPGMVHVFPMFGFLPTSRRALAESVAFLLAA